MGEINPRDKLSSEDYLYLYWFEKITDGVEIEYDKFQPTESMINRFNAYIQEWNKRFASDRIHYEKPVDWDVDRQKTGYFKDKLQVGHEFEIWVEEQFMAAGIDLKNYLDEKGQYTGENEFGLEIKHDTMLVQTGNLYIEYEERLKKNNNWVRSGILKDDNTKYWIIGSFNEYYFFYKKDLCDIYAKLLQNPNGYTGCRFVREKTNGTSKGFIINREMANNICIAKSISEFINKLSKKYYANGYYYHGKRDCKYIANKNDDSITIFDDEDKAKQAGYVKCTSKDCFSES